MNLQPLVSVIMCVYNAGSYLRPAVASVLGQTYENLEILVVDDGSTDGCIEAVADLLGDPRVRVIRQENSGKPAAMNVALANARGEFYALNDADDLSAPTRVEQQVHAMQTHPDVAAVFTGYEVILGARRVAPLAVSKDQERCRRDIERFAMPSHDPTGMYRFSAVRDMQYESSLPIVEGYDYILRVGEQHPMLVVGECLYGYRIHSQSVTKRNPARREALVREVLRRACLRRGIDFQRSFPNEVNGGRNPKSQRDLDNNLAAHFIESVLDQRRSGRRLGAFRTGLQCSRLHLLDPHYHKAVVYAVSPRWVVRRLRRTGEF